MANSESLERARLADLDIEPLLQNEYTWALLLVLVALGFSFLQPKSGNENINVPIIGSKHSWIARWRFFSEASKAVNEGYSKVGNSPLNQSGEAKVTLFSVQDRDLQAKRT